MEIFETARREPLFFMHIPKTAGTSMRLFLLNQYHRQDVCPAAGWNDLARDGLNLSRYRLVQGHFEYNLRDILPPAMRMLAIFRDPLLRTLSSLRHLQRDPNFHQDHRLAKNLSLSDMICQSGLLLRQKNVQAAALCASRPPADVLAFLRQPSNQNRGAEASELEDEPSLDLALNRLNSIDFIGVAEALDEAIWDISETLLLHPTHRLAAINQAPDGATGLDGLTTEAVQMLKAANDLDVPLYRSVLKLSRQRQFEHEMQRRIDSGVYKRPNGSFELDLREPIPGCGWYEPDSENGNVWRWTGPDPCFTIELSLQSSSSYSAHISFTCLYPLNTDHLCIELNGKSTRVNFAEDDGNHIMTIEIPEHMIRQCLGHCRISINVGRTAQPTEQRGDVRFLGIAVNRISFEAHSLQ